MAQELLTMPAKSVKIDGEIWSNIKLIVTARLPIASSDGGKTVSIYDFVNNILGPAAKKYSDQAMKVLQEARRKGGDE